MKTKYLLLIGTGVALCLNACKKNDDYSSNGQLVGKWYENKLVLHEITGTDTFRDTTFTSADFTTDDYFQFNPNSTAVISKSGTFSFSGKSTVELANKLYDFVTHYNYKIKDSLITMTLTDPVPTALTGSDNSITRIESVVQLDANHLVMHIDIIPQSSTTYPPGVTTTAYFTKEK
jgi:hypothetical protein